MNSVPIPQPARQLLAAALYKVFEGDRTVGKESFFVDTIPTGYILRNELIRMEPAPLEHSVRIETDAGGRPLSLSFRSRAAGEGASCVIRVYTDRWFVTHFTEKGRTDYFLPHHPYFLSPLCAFLTILERRVPVTPDEPETFPVVTVDATTLVPSVSEVTLKFIGDEDMNGTPAHHYILRGPKSAEHFWTSGDGLVLARGLSREVVTHQLQELLR